MKLQNMYWIYPWKVLFDFTKIYLSDENLHFAAQSNFTEKVFSGKIWASSFDTMFEQRNDYYSSKSNDNSDPFTTFSFISKFNGLFQCKDVSHISQYSLLTLLTKPLNSGKETSINSIDGKYWCQDCWTVFQI